MRLRTLIPGLLFLALTAIPAVAQRSMRLILKDGSYQVVSEWKVKGDRVSYFSVERHDWEDVPNELIDWKATDAYNATNGPRRRTETELDREMKEEEAAEAADRAAEEAQSPRVAPGLKLPPQGGVFAVDRFQQQPQLVELVQNGSELNKNIGRNILRAAINPLPTGSKQTIELKGPHSRVQLHTASPALYIDIDQDTQQQSVDTAHRFRLVKVETRKNARVVGNLKINLIGKTKQETREVPVTVEKYSGDWVKVMPQTTLDSGEYALVEMLGDKSMNSYVWDFGVDPAAPANPSAWKPEPLKQNSTGTEASPVLLPKK